jgi:hypothetical protein
MNPVLPVTLTAYDAAGCARRRDYVDALLRLAGPNMSLSLRLRRWPAPR